MRETSDKQFNKIRNKINKYHECFTKWITFKKINKETKHQEILELKYSVKEIKNELVILGNRADHMEQRTADIKDRNLEMTRMKTETREF